jgi:cobalt-zinc-cadmium efflux system protein
MPASRGAGPGRRLEMNGHSHAGHAGHGHAHGHGHDHVAAGDASRLGVALAITVVFMAVEVAGGWLAGSLALIADAGHMLVDAAALALALLALRASRRPADAQRSYGHQRAQVVAALVNGLALLALGLWVVVEAVQRLFAPEIVDGRIMLLVAAVGGASNVVALLVLRGGDHGNLNMTGAWLHVMSDLAGSIAAMLAAGIIIATGWTPIDPILSILIALLFGHAAWTLIRQSNHVLMEGTPSGLDVADMRTALVAGVEGVVEVHHVHAWSLTPSQSLVTLHAEVADGADRDAVLRQIKLVLKQRFAIAHTTIQLEAAGCADRSEDLVAGCH